MNMESAFVVCWPQPLPDEYFDSWIIRLGRTNGLGSGRRRLAAVLQRAGLSHPGEPALDLPHASGLSDGVAHVVRTTSLSSYYHLLSWPVTAPHTPAERRADLRLPIFHQRIPKHLRYCPDCASLDRREHRIAYWHRCHQLPSTFVCETHCRPLFEVAVPKIERSVHGHLPLDPAVREWTNPIQAPLGGGDLAQRLAKLGRHLLEFDETAVAPSEIVSSIVDGLMERGLATMQGVIQRDKFLAEFSRRYLSGDAVARGWRHDVGGNRVLLALRGNIRGGPWTERLLLLDWLFGSWGGCVNRIEWLRTMGDTSRSRSRTAKRNAEVLVRETQRSRCAAFLRTNPVGTRTDLARHDYRLYRWLISRDPDWFDLVLPPASRSLQYELF